VLLSLGSLIRSRPVLSEGRLDGCLLGLVRRGRDANISAAG
jgi:hypothetical protein